MGAGLMAIFMGAPLWVLGEISMRAVTGGWRGRSSSPSTCRLSDGCDDGVSVVLIDRFRFVKEFDLSRAVKGCISLVEVRKDVDDWPDDVEKGSDDERDSLEPNVFEVRS